MTPGDDRSPDMGSRAHIDAAIERVLRGDAVGDDAAPFAAFIDDMQVMADRPPPPPSPELATVLSGSVARDPAPASVASLPPRGRSNVPARPTRPSSRRRRTSGMRRRAVALGVGAKAAALVLALVTTAVAGAAAGILPDPATHLLRRAVEAVTPFEMPDDAAAHPDGDADPVGSTEAAQGEELPEASATGVPTRPADVAADQGPRPLPDLTEETSSGADADAETWTSAGPADTATPASSPPEELDPPMIPAPHAGPATPPAPKPGHVPPGQSPSGTPHGDGSDGGAPFVDGGTPQDHSQPPAPKDSPPGRRTPQGAHSPPAHDGSHGGSHEQLEGSGPGPRSPGEAPPSGHHPLPPSDAGPDREPDGDQCGQPSGTPPAGCHRADPDRGGPSDAGDEGHHSFNGGNGDHAGPAAATGGPGPSVPDRG
jgi:hypothetical protein